MPDNIAPENSSSEEEETSSDEDIETDQFKSSTEDRGKYQGTTRSGRNVYAPKRVHFQDTVNEVQVNAETENIKASINKESEAKETGGSGWTKVKRKRRDRKNYCKKP